VVRQMTTRGGDPERPLDVLLGMSLMLFLVAPPTRLPYYRAERKP
jgi:hypothetical protein